MKQCAACSITGVMPKALETNSSRLCERSAAIQCWCETGLLRFARKDDAAESKSGAFGLKHCDKMYVQPIATRAFT